MHIAIQKSMNINELIIQLKSLENEKLNKGREKEGINK